MYAGDVIEVSVVNIDVSVSFVPVGEGPEVKVVVTVSVLVGDTVVDRKNELVGALVEVSAALDEVVSKFSVVDVELSRYDVEVSVVSVVGVAVDNELVSTSKLSHHYCYCNNNKVTSYITVNENYKNVKKNKKTKTRTFTTVVGSHVSC